jgi:hypothetical protein
MIPFKMSIKSRIQQEMSPANFGCKLYDLKCIKLKVFFIFF